MTTAKQPKTPKRAKKEEAEPKAKAEKPEKTAAPKAAKKTAPAKKPKAAVIKEPKAAPKKKPVSAVKKPAAKPVSVSKPAEKAEVHKPEILKPVSAPAEHKPAAAPHEPKPAPAPKPVSAPAAKPAVVKPPVSPAVKKIEIAPIAAPAAAPAAAKPEPAPAPVPLPAAAAVVPVEPVPAAPPKPVIKVTGQPTVRELAEKMGLKVSDFIKKLMGMGVYATINQRLEPDLASLVAGECGFELEVQEMFAEKELESLQPSDEKPENLKPRPPVVTIMGHVDHGKTSLLDAIRSSDVCSTEAGAITQHIGAYRVCHPKGDIVFLDTPGHEAFTAMRARGAQATDIVVLVVSATDGIMPQTIEAIDHARAAAAPIMVAINKIDLPGANPAKVKQELAQHGLQPEEWQGKTVFVEISAKKRINIEKLLEMILLQAEMMNLKANPDKPGAGIILEARRDSKRGVVATVLAKTGTVKVGDSFIAGASCGRVRALIDEHGARLSEIRPAMPAEVLGFTGEPPQVGDIFHVVESEKEAKQIAGERQRALREESLAHQKHVTLLGLRSQVAAKKLKTLQVILKCDTLGSIQAIRDSLEKLSNDEVEIKIIHSGAGNVNESDILLAKASDAIVLAFHVGTESKAKDEAEHDGIEIRDYTIIFELFDEVKAAMEGLLEPEKVESVVGRADVKQAFRLSSGTVAGCLIAEGKLTRGSMARVRRLKEILHRGKITSLKRFKEDVKEVEKGFECGIVVDGYKDIKPGDAIEQIETKTILRRIETGEQQKNTA